MFEWKSCLNIFFWNRIVLQVNYRIPLHMQNSQFFVLETSSERISSFKASYQPSLDHTKNQNWVNANKKRRRPNSSWRASRLIIHTLSIYFKVAIKKILSKGRQDGFYEMKQLYDRLAFIPVDLINPSWN